MLSRRILKSTIINVSLEIRLMLSIFIILLLAVPGSTVDSWSFLVVAE